MEQNDKVPERTAGNFANNDVEMNAINQPPNNMEMYQVDSTMNVPPASDNRNGKFHNQ